MGAGANIRLVSFAFFPVFLLLAPLPGSLLRDKGDVQHVPLLQFFHLGWGWWVGGCCFLLVVCCPVSVLYYMSVIFKHSYHSLDAG